MTATSMDRETQYDSPTASVRFALEQFKKGLYTAAPGHVVAYNATTRRATVQPALDKLLMDGSVVTAPLIGNVPVIWPVAGGYALLGNFAVGDPVLLVWSRRGLTGFKGAHGRSLPDVDHIMDFADAIAVPGFGPVSATPISTTGMAIQSLDGEEFVAVEPTGIRIKTGGIVAVEAAGMTLNGQQVQTA